MLFPCQASTHRRTPMVLLPLNPSKWPMRPFSPSRRPPYPAFYYCMPSVYHHHLCIILPHRSCYSPSPNSFLFFTTTLSLHCLCHHLSFIIPNPLLPPPSSSSICFRVLPVLSLSLSYTHTHSPTTTISLSYHLLHRFNRSVRHIMGRLFDSI